MTDKSPLATHVYRPSMHTRIANFGFELEMLPEGEGGGDREEEWESCYECSGDGYTYDSCDCGEEGCETHDDVSMPCEACGGEGGEYEERSGEPSDRFRRLLRMAEPSTGHKYDACGYHCTCRHCRPERTTPFLAVQQDCTVGVEFITRICNIHDENTRADIDTVVGWYGDALALWTPDGYSQNGNHVHVSNSGTNDGSLAFHSRRRQQAFRLMSAVYAATDWETAAAGKCRNGLRGYNSKPAPYGQGIEGSWLRQTGYATFEHRLWNTPAASDRLYGHVAVSLALTRWAYAVTFTPTPSHFLANNDGHRVVDEVERTWPILRKQIEQYLPDYEHFHCHGMDVLHDVKAPSLVTA